jgi:hypothetical protein
MEKMKKGISLAAAILCFATSILVLLYLFHYLNNVVVLYILTALAFVVSVFNLLFIIKTRSKKE